MTSRSLCSRPLALAAPLALALGAPACALDGNDPPAADPAVAATPQNVGAPGDPLPAFLTRSVLFTGLNFGLPSSWQLATGDFNGDGRIDFARLGDVDAFIYFAKDDGTFHGAGPAVRVQRRVAGRHR